MRVSARKTTKLQKLHKNSYIYIAHSISQNLYWWFTYTRGLFLKKM